MSAAATLVLHPKTTAVPFTERSPSGRTISGDDDAQKADVVSIARDLYSARTWTKSLLEKSVLMRGQDQPGLVLSFEPLSSSTSASVALTSYEYRVTLDRVRMLLTDEDEQDRPSAEAYARTIQLLRETAQQLGMQFPSAIAATGPGRSVRLLWSSDKKELRLVVGGSAANRSYVYWQEAGRSGVDETIHANRFARYLDWITQDV